MKLPRRFSLGLIERVARTFALAARSLARAPRFTLLAVLPVALAVGMTTALFSVIESVLLSPLPYPDPDRLVRVLRASRDNVEPWQSGPNLIEILERQTSFAALAGWAEADGVLGGLDEAMPVRATQVTAHFFETLGPQVREGRFFTPIENEPGQNAVAVVSHTLFANVFGGDPAVIGTTVPLNGEPVRIVGVAPPSFDYPADTDLWTPLPYGPRIRDDNYRGGNFLEVVGRLRPGVAMPQAQQELDAIFADIESRFPSGSVLRLVTLRDHLVGAMDRPLRLLFASMMLVLLIASANVASLLLGRGASRTAELAVRRAIGAGSARIFGLLVSEGLILAGIAAALGAGIATAALRGVTLLSVLGVPRLDEAALDARVLLAGVGLCTAVVVAFASLPALLDARGRGAATLGSGARGSRAEGIVLRRALVLAEVALSMVLLTGAGLMLRSFSRLTAVETGMNAGDVLAADIALRQSRYQAPGATAALTATLEESLRAIPGVAAAAITSGLPLEGNGNRMTFEIVGQPPFDPATRPYLNIRAVSADYFRTLGIPVLRGAAFTGADGPSAPQVAVIDASAERAFFPDRSPIGQSIRLARRNVEARIVAVVGDVHATGLTTDAEPHIYLPLAQFPLGVLTITVRGTGRTDGLAARLRRAVRDADPELAIDNIRTIDEVVTRALARPRLITRLLLLAAALALAITATGLFGVVAYHVAARRKELGIRAVLGGGPARLVRDVMTPILPVIAIGSAIGAAGSIAAGRIMSALLFRSGTIETGALIGASLLLLLIAAAAALAPAVAAATTPPAMLIRQD